MRPYTGQICYIDANTVTGGIAMSIGNPFELFDHPDRDRATQAIMARVAEALCVYPEGTADQLFQGSTPLCTRTRRTTSRGS